MYLPTYLSTSKSLMRSYHFPIFYRSFCKGSREKKLLLNQISIDTQSLRSQRNKEQP